MEITKLIYTKAIASNETLVVIGLINNLTPNNYRIVIRDRIEERLLASIKNYAISCHKNAMENDMVYNESEIDEMLARYYTGYIDEDFNGNVMSTPEFVKKIMESEIMNNFLDKLFSKINIVIENEEVKVNEAEGENESEFDEIKEYINDEYSNKEIEILTIIEALSSISLNI